MLVNIEDYLWEGMRQLSNTEHYSRLTEPIYRQTRKEVEEILKEMYENKIISGKQKKYLVGPGSPRASRLYLLPKIHKKKTKLDQG